MRFILFGLLCGALTACNSPAEQPNEAASPESDCAAVALTRPEGWIFGVAPAATPQEIMSGFGINFPVMLGSADLHIESITPPCTLHVIQNARIQIERSKLTYLSMELYYDNEDVRNASLEALILSMKEKANNSPARSKYMVWQATVDGHRWLLECRDLSALANRPGMELVMHQATNF
jgi:hypothetical protein